MEGSENIGKILLISFNDDEKEIIESVLAALGTGRNIYCDENNIKPLKKATFINGFISISLKIQFPTQRSDIDSILSFVRPFSQQFF